MTAKILASVNLFAALDAARQPTITIAGRNLQRAAAMRGEMAGARPQAQVQIASCNSCGVPSKMGNDGIVIAQCGCGGGPVAFASSVPTGTGMGMPGGGYVANPPGVYPDPSPGGWPLSLCDRATLQFKRDSWSEMLRRSRMRQMPYVDPYYDSVWMDELLGPVTTAPVGATTLEVTPEAGTFAAFYYEIVAVDPTTQVQQVDWRAARPRIEGCPVPCSSGTTQALAQLIMKVPESCCGTPMIAWLDEASRGTPLQIPFTNNQAAGDLLVQVRLRGYCCNERIC